MVAASWTRCSPHATAVWRANEITPPTPHRNDPALVGNPAASCANRRSRSSPGPRKGSAPVWSLHIANSLSSTSRAYRLRHSRSSHPDSRSQQQDLPMGRSVRRGNDPIDRCPGSCGVVVRGHRPVGHNAHGHAVACGFGLPDRSETQQAHSRFVHLHHGPASTFHSRPSNALVRAILLGGVLAA